MPGREGIRIPPGKKRSRRSTLARRTVLPFLTFPLLPGLLRHGTGRVEESRPLGIVRHFLSNLGACVGCETERPGKALAEPLGQVVQQLQSGLHIDGGERRAPRMVESMDNASHRSSQHHSRRRRADQGAQLVLGPFSIFPGPELQHARDAVRGGLREHPDIPDQGLAAGQSDLDPLHAREWQYGLESFRQLGDLGIGSVPHQVPKTSRGQTTPRLQEGARDPGSTRRSGVQPGGEGGLQHEVILEGIEVDRWIVEVPVILLVVEQPDPERLKPSLGRVLPEADQLVEGQVAKERGPGGAPTAEERGDLPIRRPQSGGDGGGGMVEARRQDRAR